LEPQWWDLWHRDPDASPFQSPAWLLPWARQFDAGQSRVLAIREGDRLVALLPMFRHEGRLLPWGAGTTDRLDGVFDPAFDQNELTRGLSKFSEPLDLFQLRPDSPLSNTPLPSGWAETRGFSVTCLEVPLPARLPHKMRENIRNYRNRARADGFDSPERVGWQAFENLVELHTRRWNEREQSGVLADPRVLAWHREALPLLERAGLLRFYAIQRDGAAGAVLYALYAKGRCLCYLSGFDPQFAPLGLGTVLLAHAISEAEREGATVVDFLRGREPYKYHWGVTEQPTYSRYLKPMAA
jgi:CelD/BcsL family acetyltransferase involved in cellulose biosynthesis